MCPCDCHMILGRDHMTCAVCMFRLEEQGKIDSAIACYREALTLDPEEVTARERLGILTAAIEMKVRWLPDKDRGNHHKSSFSFLSIRPLRMYVYTRWMEPLPIALHCGPCVCVYGLETCPASLTVYSTTW